MSFSGQNLYFRFSLKLPQRALIFLVPFSYRWLWWYCFVYQYRQSAGILRLLVSPWLTSWGISWAIAFPTVLFVLPFARKLSLLLVRSS